jgi:signal peptidase
VTAPTCPRRAAGRLVLAAVLAVAGLGVVVQVLGLGATRAVSGSMGSAVPVGSLAVTREVPASAVEVGDVVQVPQPGGGTVTHRVVTVRPGGDGTTSLVLRGDANRTADPAPYAVRRVGTVLLTVPYLGDPRVAGGAAAGTLVLTVLVVRRRPRHRRGAGAHLPVGAPAGASATLALVLLAATTSPTAAAWSDAATVTSGRVGTVGTVPSPSAPTCSPTGSSVEVGWANVGGRYRHRATLHRLGSDVQLGSVVDVPPATGSRVSRMLGPTAFGALAADGPLNGVVRVEALPSASSTWTSPSSVDVAVHLTADRSAVRCGHDTSTSVTFAAVVDDSGVAGDLVTNVARNAVRGTAEPGAAVVVRRGSTRLATTVADADGSWTSPRLDLVEGSQTLTVTATDETGNTAEASRTVVLDTVAPQLTASTASCPDVGNPVDGVAGVRWCRATSLRWTVQAENPGSGLDALQYSDGGDWTRYDQGVDLHEGAGRLVRARATDRAGNVATTEDRTWLDGTPPRVRIDYPWGGGTLLSGTLLAGLAYHCGGGSAGCGTVEDDLSGVAQVRWSLERSGWVSGWLRDTSGATFSSPETLHDASLSGNRWSAAVSSPGLVYGGLLRTYTLRVAQATDRAGNVAWSPATTSFYVALF